jgi:hypothetical protein
MGSVWAKAKERQGKKAAPRTARSFRDSYHVPAASPQAPKSAILILVIVVMMVMMMMVVMMVLLVRLNQVPYDGWNVATVAVFAIIILRQLSSTRRGPGFCGVRRPQERQCVGNRRQQFGE